MKFFDLFYNLKPRGELSMLSPLMVLGIAFSSLLMLATFSNKEQF